MWMERTSILPLDWTKIFFIVIKNVIFDLLVKSVRMAQEYKLMFREPTTKFMEQRKKNQGILQLFIVGVLVTSCQALSASQV